MDRQRMINIAGKYADSLPVNAISGQIRASLREHARLVVMSPPGSGKSTLLPLIIHQALPEGKVIMLEPRRAAARQIAMRMSQMIGENTGDTVGYRMRFESMTSPASRIEVVTEGIMERMLVEDPTLDGVSAVIFDEFHERSLATDLCLALCRVAQEIVRPDLRIVIMSATMDAEELCRRLDAQLVTSEGRMYDVDIVYGEDYDVRECADKVAATVRRAYREQMGNILAFLPGQGEINRCQELLESTLSDAVVMPLHGQLAPAEQYRAIEFNPSDEKRKIVLATPIAETSLTIEGIRTVVDSCLCREVRFDAATGLSRLETVPISMDMARQRAGRAGRLCEGVCYRMWSGACESRASENRKPEIVEADLSQLVLEIAAWGGERPEALPWLTAPAPGHIAEAERLLKMLGALDDSGGMTSHGRRMTAYPCHPRIANILVTATTPEGKALAADIAALLEEKDPLFDDNNADICTRIDMLRRFRRSGGVSGRWKRIERIAANYRRMMRCAADNSWTVSDEVGLLVAAAYPERIAMRVGDGMYRMASGDNVRLNEGDDLAVSDFLAVASVGRRIFLASPVSREALLGIAKDYENVSWNSREGRLMARLEKRIGTLAITSRQLDNPDPGVIAGVIVAAAVKEGRSMFDFNDDVSSLQNRIEKVAEWHPELSIPDVSTEALTAVAGEWLPMYLGKATTRQELRKIDMCAVIAGLVGYGNMAEIDRLAPTRLRLPCGRHARIDYRPGSPHPVVSARLQDCFGLSETPRVDDGRRPVLMELLSPGYKPVQLTQDLGNFWSTTYFEVRKELRRRYPKHRWPDDPAS